MKQSQEQKADEEQWLSTDTEKYWNIIEKINGAVYIIDENGIITFISKSAQNIVGYEQDEILGKNFLEFVPEEDKQIAIDGFSKIEAGKNSLLECHLKTRNGKLKLMAIISTAIVNKFKFAGALGVLLDITKSKETERGLEIQSCLFQKISETIIAINLMVEGIPLDISNSRFVKAILQEVQQRLRNLLENSNIIFYSYTPDNIINFVSPHSKKLLGFDPAEIKMRWTDLITDNPINQKAIELTRLAIETGIPQEPFEIEMQIKKGETGWFEVREIPVVKDAKTVIIVGSLSDITDRKKAEEELQANQSLLIDALEMAKMGHWKYNVATDTFTFNDQFYKMMRTSVEEMGSYTLSSAEYIERFFHPDDYASVWKEIKDSISTTDPNYQKEFEHRIIFSDGEIGTVAVRFKVEKDRNGNTIRTYGVNQDITKQKSVEMELVEAKEKAEEASRLKSSLLTNMSHELRTPMVGVLGLAEMLLDELADPGHIEMVSIIMRSGRRLISTLNSILDISRIEANKQDIKTSPVNLNETIKEVATLFSANIEDKRISIKCILPEQNVYINSDDDLLHKVFTNLIDNAVKYTNEGNVVVRLTTQEEESHKNVLVEISDTGIGIPKEFHKVIFEPFRQVSEGFSREYEGTGLGLSITKKIIELLNGSITLNSEPGKGSTFTITFDSSNIVEDYTPAFDTSAGIKETDEIHFNNINVLLVEDDIYNAQTISAYLENFVTVDLVSNGNAAILVCNSIKYDAILMDINLKGIDGVETLREIRKINMHYSHIPIIATTAYAMPGDREKFLSLGFTHYLPKPFFRSEIRLLLTKIFNNE